MTNATLFIVATPIGNLADISERAVETLRQVDLIAAEDTRHSKQLLQHYQINTPMISLHAHNESEREKKILDLLNQGQSVALISDAGTPIVSDPGAFLVRHVQDAGFAVSPIPGACAAIAGLSASGLADGSFLFYGFLPAKSGARLKQLEALLHEPHILIFYEAPHRILASLQAMVTVFGEEREIVMARELTKRFETIRRGGAKALLDWMRQDVNQQKGEFVLLVAPSPDKAEDKDEAIRVLSILLADLPVKQASSLAAQITGFSKSSLYREALALKNSQ